MNAAKQDLTYSETLLEHWKRWSKGVKGCKGYSSGIYGKTDHDLACEFSDEVMERVDRTVGALDMWHKTALKDFYIKEKPLAEKTLDNAIKAFDRQWSLGCD